MKRIILTAESHSPDLECEGVEFKRAATDSPEDQNAVVQLVDDAKAETILRNPLFAEAPPEPEPVKSFSVEKPPVVFEPAK